MLAYTILISNNNVEEKYKLLFLDINNPGTGTYTLKLPKDISILTSLIVFYLVKE